MACSSVIPQPLHVCALPVSGSLEQYHRWCEGTQLGCITWYRPGFVGEGLLVSLHLAPLRFHYCLIHWEIGLSDASPSLTHHHLLGWSARLGELSCCSHQRGHHWDQLGCLCFRCLCPLLVVLVLDVLAAGTLGTVAIATGSRTRDYCK